MAFVQQQSGHKFKNMMRVILILLLLLSAGMGAVGFLKYFIARAHAINQEMNLPHGCENGIKHSMAAAAVYSALTMVRLPENFSESTASKMGIFNEWLETWYLNESSAEMAKDLHNNHVGIAAEQFLQRHSSRADIGETLGKLCESGILFQANGQVVLQGWSGNKLDDARQWYLSQIPAIKSKVALAIEQ